MPESSLNTITKPCSCLSHCKVSCDSPCCVKLGGKDNHCIFNTDTHENVISDSDEEHIEEIIITILAERSASISNNDILFFDFNIHDGPRPRGG